MRIRSLEYDDMGSIGWLWGLRGCCAHAECWISESAYAGMELSILVCVYLETWVEDDRAFCATDEDYAHQIV